MPNPRIAALSAEFTLKRSELDALDTIAANESRDFTDVERADYEANVTRMEAIEADLTSIRTRQARFDAVAAVTASITPGAVRSAARTNPRVAQLSHDEQMDLMVRAAHGDEDSKTRWQAFSGERAEVDAGGTLTRDGAVVHNVSTDGVSPTTIEGDLTKLVDATRYAVGSTKQLPIPDNRSKTFERPRVATFTDVDIQTNQGDVLESEQFTITADTVTKATYGGVVAVSEQTGDWTEPNLLGQIPLDLAERYAIRTEIVTCAAIEAAVDEGTETVLALTANLADFIAGIGASSLALYKRAKRMPNTLYVAPDRFFYIASLVDGDGRLAFPVHAPMNVAGMNPAGVTSWGSLNVMGLNVVVSPQFSDNVMITAATSLVETYEQNKGLLSIQAPSTLETLISYRGYFATRVIAEGVNGIEAA